MNKEEIKNCKDIEKLRVEALIWRKFADEWANDRCYCSLLVDTEKPCSYHRLLMNYHKENQDD